MQRFPLLHALEIYRAADPHEEQMRQRIIAFVTDHEDFYSRHLAVGHLTGSAWIVDEDFAATLLLHHNKLDKWLQPGGHVEDDTHIQAAAAREVLEETGLREIRPLCSEIFDVDIHAIPARPQEPAHFHYDIRYAFIASPQTLLTINSESKSLRWVLLDEIHALTREESILRMVRKTTVRRAIK